MKGKLIVTAVIKKHDRRHDAGNQASSTCNSHCNSHIRIDARIIFVRACQSLTLLTNY